MAADVAITISGSVVDAEGKGVPGSSVALRRLPDSVLVTGAITRADGGFTISGVRPGRYIARVSGVGFTPRLISPVEVRPGKDTLDLGRIELVASAVNADEVVVNARRDFMTVTADRTVYSTKDLLVSTGGSATDLLKNIPSVEVDADGNVSLRGNQNIAIQLNGRPSGLTADALKSLPADAIERIEIVANPSAKYDPEGIGGILNIVLKQDHDRGLAGGFNGSAGINGSYSLGANINWGSGPWNVLANYGVMRWVRDANGYRLQKNLLVNPVTGLLSTDTSSGGSTGHSFNASIDYALDKANTISLSTAIGAWGSDADETANYADLTADGAVTSRSVRHSNDDGADFSQDHRLGYKWVGQPRVHELTAELRYASSREDNATWIDERTEPMDASPASVVASMHNRVLERSNEEALQIDYVRPLWEGGSLEAGYKGSFRGIDNDYVADSLDPATRLFRAESNASNAFNFNETIHAAYGTVSQEIGTVSLQVGLRAERATTSFDLRTTSETFDNAYTSLFPSALVSWRPSDATQVRISYGKRVNRPRTGQLNPFSVDGDRGFARVGNPYLLPEYSHNIELGFTQFVPWGTITLNPFFRHTVNAIEHFDVAGPNGVIIGTFENLGKTDSWGAELINSVRVGDWLTGFANLSAYRLISDATNLETGGTGDGIGLTARGNVTVSVGWGIDIQGSAFYRAPMDLIGGRMRSSVYTDLAIQKRILDDRGRIGLRFSNPFVQGGFGAERQTYAYYIDFERHWNPPAATLSFSYIFGKQDARTRQQRPVQQQGGDDDMGW